MCDFGTYLTWINAPFNPHADSVELVTGAEQKSNALTNFDFLFTLLFIINLV